MRKTHNQKKKKKESAQEPCMIKIWILILFSTIFYNKNKSSSEIHSYIDTHFKSIPNAKVHASPVLQIWSSFQIYSHNELIKSNPPTPRKFTIFFFFKWTKIKAWNFNSMQASWYTNNKQKSIKTQKPNCVSNSSKTHYIFQINNKKSYQSLACQYSKLGLNDHLKKDPETELEKEENHTHLTETQKGKE